MTAHRHTEDGGIRREAWLAEVIWVELSDCDANDSGIATGPASNLAEDYKVPCS